MRKKYKVRDGSPLDYIVTIGKVIGPGALVTAVIAEMYFVFYMIGG